MFQALMVVLLSTLAFAHPLISIDIKNKTPKQGDALWVKIQSSKAISSGTVALNKKKFKLFKKTTGPATT